jgi:hypothetical protein
MFSTLSRLPDNLDNDFHSQIAALSNEISALRKAVSRRSSAAYDDTLDTAAGLYGEVRNRLADTVPLIRRQARNVERSARDHPATAAMVGLVVVGLVVALLARR